MDKDTKRTAVIISVCVILMFIAGILVRLFIVNKQLYSKEYDKVTVYRKDIDMHDNIKYVKNELLLFTTDDIEYNDVVKLVESKDWTVVNYVKEQNLYEIRSNTKMRYNDLESSIELFTGESIITRATFNTVVKLK